MYDNKFNPYPSESEILLTISLLGPPKIQPQIIPTPLPPVINCNPLNISYFLL